MKKHNGYSESAQAVEQTCYPIIELRQYTLHPGQRDVLIALFDREFVESQEELGMKVIGQFRDLQNPNTFVWIRGFRDMSSRVQGLTAFYNGPVWKTHRESANSTLVDSSNVLLLRPARPSSGFSPEPGKRPAPDTTEVPEGVVVATFYSLHGPADDNFIDFFERSFIPEMRSAGASILAYYITESSENNFPRLPVREDEHFFVWFAGFSDQATYERHVDALSQSPLWRDEISEVLAYRLKKSPEFLLLTPTARSEQRGLNTADD
jgi:quinol monooxygenase YgiN